MNGTFFKFKSTLIKYHPDTHAQLLRVGSNAEGNSSNRKFTECTNQDGDNEAAQEQVEVGEVRRRSVVFFPLAQFITQHEGGEV
jgi:hypothetical protein